jgi:hypothetical protein
MDSNSPTLLAIATAGAILDNLADPLATTGSTEGDTGVHLGDRESILSLASDLQNILGDAMDLATTMFPLKASTPDKRQTRPHHLWPKSVLHDIHAIRNRTKALRRIAALVASHPDRAEDTFSDSESPHHKLWLRVTTPLTLRTEAHPPIRNQEALSLLVIPSDEDDDT